MKTMKNLNDAGGLNALADIEEMHVDAVEEVVATGGQAGPDQAGILEKASEGSDSFYLQQ